jgi:hypothetical protein
VLPLPLTLFSHEPDRSWKELFSLVVIDSYSQRTKFDLSGMTKKKEHQCIPWSVYPAKGCNFSVDLRQKHLKPDEIYRKNRNVYDTKYVYKNIT